MNDVAIRVEQLSKCYTIDRTRARHDTMRDLAAHAFKSLGRRADTKRSKSTVWALKEVTFDIRQGDTVGLIGRNGAGKSTLLKVLSRITEPSSGRAQIRGRIGSLLEVGTGFDRELTGRENIFLSGAILGLRKAEIQRKFDEIVAFSEIEQFIDTPVKRYSSGMYVRLAFAVAAHLESEVLLVDEVLAVGDASFQRKCLGKIDDLAHEARTVIFVSHNMAAVTRLCRTGIWIDAGEVRQIGPAADVGMSYLDQGQHEVAEVDYSANIDSAPGSEIIRLVAARLSDDQGAVTGSFPLHSSQTIEVDYRILRATSSLRLGITLVTPDGTIVLNTKDTDCGSDMGDREPGLYSARCTIPAGLLRKGHYAVRIGSDMPNVQKHFLIDRVLSFSLHDISVSGGELADRDGLVQLRLPWTVERVA